MNIKVILSVIENNRCLTDMRCFGGLGIFSIQNKSTISRLVPLYIQLTLYCFLDCLSIHYYQFVCRQKAKAGEAYWPQLFHWPDEKGDLCLS